MSSLPLSRKCKKCGVKKQLNAFKMEKLCKDGVLPTCRVCMSELRSPRILEPDLPGEAWKPVIGFEDVYSVSNLGRIKRELRVAGARPGRLCKLRLSRNGYLRVVLCKGNKTANKPVHCLVIEAFLHPKPNGYQVNHKDGNKQHNAFSNLEYLTPSENTRHAYENKLIDPACGERSHLSKLTEDEVRAIRTFGSQLSQGKIAKLYGVNRATIGAILRGETWRHVT